jgi:hypothetical protein
MNESPGNGSGASTNRGHRTESPTALDDDLLRPVRQASQLTATGQLNFDDTELLRHITDEPSLNIWQSLRLRSWFLCLQGSVYVEISKALACNAPNPQRS